MEKNDLSVLICSCDKYEDVWNPFFVFFKKEWEDCPYPVYLMTDEKIYNDPLVKTITTGQMNDWSSRFLKAIDQVAAKYILILMEDYLLLAKPNEDFLEKAVDFMRENKVSYLRLFPRPGPDRIITNLDGIEIGEIAKNTEYRVSLQAAIWDVDYLRKVVKVGESAWDLEISGTERTNDLPDKLFSVSTETKYPISYYCTAVVKGYWDKNAVKLCRKNKVEIDLTKRKVEPFYIHRNIRPIIELIDLKNNLKKRFVKYFKPSPQ